MPNLLEMRRAVKVQPAPQAPVNQSFDRVASALDNFGTSLLGIAQLQGKKDAQERKVELQTSRAAANIDIRDNINRIKEEHLDPKSFGTDSLDRFENATRGYLEGVLPTIEPGNRDAVNNNAMLHVEQAREQIRRQLRVTSTHRMQADLTETYLKGKQDAENLAFEGDAVSAAGIAGEIDRNLNTALDSGLISPEKFVTFRESLNKSLQENTYLGDFHRAMEHDETDQSIVVQEKFQTGEKYLESFEKAENTGLSPQEKERMVIKMRGQLRARRQSLKVRTSKINEEMDDVVIQVQNGEDPENLPEVAALVEQAQPNKSLIFQRRVENARFFSAASDQIRFLSEPQRQLAEQAIRKEIDLAKPGAAARLETFNKIQKESEKQLREFREDPHAYELNSPEVKAAIQSYNDSGLRGVLSPQEDAKHLAQITAQASLAMQAQMGLPKEDRRVLTAAQAAFTAQQIRDNPNVSEQAAIIASTGDTYGKYSPTALKDLNRAGVPFSSMMYNSLLNNNETISLTPDANEAWSNTTADLEKSVKDVFDIKDMRADMSQELSPYFDTLGNGSTTKIINNMTEQAYKLSLVLGRKLDKGEAVKQAASSVLAHYNLDSFNGVAFRVPNSPDLSTQQVVDIGSRFRAKLTGVKGIQLFEDEDPDKKLDLQVPPYYFPELVDRSREAFYRDDLISNAHFQTLPDDSGVRLVDRTGSPVRLKNGRDFSFSFEDLSNPSSEINTLLNSSAFSFSKFQFSPIDEEGLPPSPIGEKSFLGRTFSGLIPGGDQQ